MYLYRRNGRYWFRKSVPLDLIPIIGMRDVRCSLETSRRDMAKRRSGAMLVALEHVYAVLRADEPIEPAKALLESLVEDVTAKVAGSPASIRHRKEL